MQAAVARFELHLPDVHSLKEKRSVVRPTVERLRRMASVSVAEVDFQDTWQRVELGVAVVTSGPGELDSILTRIDDYLDEHPEMTIVNRSVTFVEA